ncbi:uncharacterized protein LOC106442347 [Brassica napus]|uniref:uncharacterized protein LOC106442347 n=1 Tax=Brassica napus TaxID=3708 RepID=UPI0006AAA849|nr:uncharacterized protein LOC106442347 [Brassica napus]
MLFFYDGFVWVAWFKKVIIKGSIHNYWTTKPSSSYSWLANKLLNLKNEIFPLIKLRLENGVSAKFWFDNWTPFGSLSTFLSNSSSKSGIHEKAYVASQCRNGIWLLPPARTEEQVQLQTYFTTVTLTQAQYCYEWELEGKPTQTYSIRDVYTYLRGEINYVIWSSYEIRRHNFLVWLVIQNRGPTKEKILGWSFQVSLSVLIFGPWLLHGVGSPPLEIGTIQSLR